jgi:hypothetical protein
MTLSQVNRRTHLYLGLALLPWFLMYGISSVPFAHTRFFDDLDAAKGLPMWTLRAEKTTDIPIPEHAAGLRQAGAALLKEAGIEGASFGTYRQSPTQVNVYVYSFWKSTQLKYFTDQKRLTVEDRRFRWDHFLTGMHARGGFEQASLLDRSWSVLVDIVSVSMLLWIASGLYMWWELPRQRRRGWVAILAGTAAFVAFTLGL